MKKIILITAVSVWGTIGARSQAVVNQGIVDFANAATGVNAPVTDAFSNRISGSAWLADLFYASDPSGNPIALSSMTDAGLAQPFLTGVDAGYFTDTTSVDLDASGQILFEVVVWQSAAGSSWVQASGGGAGDLATYVENAGTQWGFSTTFLLTPNDFPSPPSSLTGLTSFNLMAAITPEPATFAIGGLGAASLVFFRRRKKVKAHSLST